jgi:hypothetical protein
MVAHTYNPSTWEAEARGSQVRGQPGLHSEPERRARMADLR